MSAGPGGGDGRAELAVAGGPASTSACLDDLDRMASALDRASARLAALAGRLTAVAADPALVVTAPRSPATWFAAERALARAAGPSGALGAAGRWALLGTSVRCAVVAYRAADAGADLAVRSVQVSALRAAPGLWVAPVVGPVAVGAVGVLAATHPAVLERVAGALPGALGVPGGIPGLAEVAVRVTRWSPWLRDGAGIAVRVPVPVVGAAPPAGVADVVRGIAALDPDTGTVPGGTVRVTAVRRPGGPTAWLVQIPGTQSWSPRAGADPLDLTGDVQGMAGRVTAGRRLVAAALERAGALPGEPVVLAGHSQGGLVAAQLATDERFRASHPVAGVLTVGAPTGACAVPASVPVVSLEHAEDVVPRADGRPNPATARWLTVTRATSGAGQAPDLARAHDLDTYAATADLVDRSTDPVLVLARSVLLPVLGGPGTTAESWLVTGERVR